MSKNMPEEDAKTTYRWIKFAKTVKNKCPDICNGRKMCTRKTGWYLAEKNLERSDSGQSNERQNRSIFRISWCAEHS